MARTATTVFKVLVLPVLCLLLLRAVYHQPVHTRKVFGTTVVSSLSPRPTGSVRSSPAEPRSTVLEMTRFVREVERKSKPPPVEPIPAENAAADEGKANKVRCEMLREAEPLPPTLTQEWFSLGCVGVPRQTAETALSATARLSAQPVQETPSNGAAAAAAAECSRMRTAYRVVPGKSWGALKPSMQRRWTELNCDAHVAGVFPSGVQGRKGRQRAEETVAERRPKSPRTQPPPQCGPVKNGTDLVALCCGTTTRTKQGWVNPSSLESMALFKHLLPSFARTADCDFRYVVVVGYDVGDKWWDLGDGVSRAERWFERHVAEPLKARGIEATLALTRVDNKVKKPGPVFTAVTKTAYAKGADYIYRVNDDTELATPWAAAFVRALKTIDNVGAVGPTCDQGNRKILTHDFTHRTHMDIFRQDYYPPALSDWWMDDWISRVYGPQRTLRGERVEVVHHTFTHGQRYQVDKSHAGLLEGLLAQGRKQIAAYIQNNSPHLSNVSPEPPAGFAAFAFSRNRRPPARFKKRPRLLGSPPAV